MYNIIIGKARRVEISTRNFGLITAAVSVFGRNLGDQAESHEMKYLPSLEETYSIWHQCHYLKVSRSQVHTQDSFRSRPRERLQVRYADLGNVTAPVLIWVPLYTAY